MKKLTSILFIFSALSLFEQSPHPIMVEKSSKKWIEQINECLNISKYGAKSLGNSYVECPSCKNRTKFHTIKSL